MILSTSANIKCEYKFIFHSLLVFYLALMEKSQALFIKPNFI